MLRALMVIALAGYVSACPSCECQDAFTAVAANPDAAACLSLDILVPSVVGVNHTHAVSDYGTVNTWLTSMCAANPCSEEVFSAAVHNITTGCSGDGHVVKKLLRIARDVRPAYPTVRKLLCLKNSDAYCVTQTLQTVFGKCTPIVDFSDPKVTNWIDNVRAIVTMLKAYAQRADKIGTRNVHKKRQLSVPGDDPTAPSPNFGPYGLPLYPNTTCTACVKDAAMIMDTDFPGAQNCLFPDLGGLCPASSDPASDTQPRSISTPPPSTQPNDTQTQSTSESANPSSKSSAVRLNAFHSSGALCIFAWVIVVTIYVVILV